MLQSELSVHDDNLADSLTGAGGRDWFFQPGEDGVDSRDLAIDRVTSGPLSESLNIASTDSAGNSALWLPSSVARPDYLGSINDPTFGTTITRLTGDATTQFITVENTGGSTTRDWSNLIKNRYVTNSPWNIDGSLIHLRSFEPLLRYPAGGPRNAVGAFVPDWRPPCTDAATRDAALAQLDARLRLTDNVRPVELAQ